MIYGKLRLRIGEILRELCRQKGVELEEDNALSDHIHMLLSVPPKYSIAMTIGYLKSRNRKSYKRNKIN
jgi:putative transposase